MLSNWSGWHTVIAILGGVGALTQYVATHSTGLDPTLLSIDQVVSQIDNVALMIVGVLSGSALSKGAT